jgi:hypothetical protein
MNLEETKQKYIVALSMRELAKELGITLASLDKLAEEHAWKEEHKLYWQDVAIEKLKLGAQEGSNLAIKELLKVVGLARPVGRPPKQEIERRINQEVKTEREYLDDVARLKEL